MSVRNVHTTHLLPGDCRQDINYHGDLHISSSGGLCSDWNAAMTIYGPYDFEEAILEQPEAWINVTNECRWSYEWGYISSNQKAELDLLNAFSLWISVILAMLKHEQKWKRTIFIFNQCIWYAPFQSLLSGLKYCFKIMYTITVFVNWLV